MFRPVSTLVISALLVSSIYARPLRRTELPPGTPFTDVEQTWTKGQTFPSLKLQPGEPPVVPTSGHLYVNLSTGYLMVHRNGSFHRVITDADDRGAVMQYSLGGVSTGGWSRININGTGVQSSLKGDTLNVTIDEPAEVGGGVAPPGSILPYAGATPPAGWLLCYGQEISRGTYADLFAAIGETYGAGDGTTTFKVPDLRGRGLFGKDDMGGSSVGRISNTGTGNPAIDGVTLGAAGGADRVTLDIANLPNHSHSLAYTESGLGIGSLKVAVEGGEAGTYTGGAAGAGAAGPNMPPTMIVNFMIRY